MAHKTKKPIVPGNILTNGKDVFGEVIYWPEHLPDDELYEITREEYEAIMAEREAQIEAEMNGGHIPSDPDAATIADYQSALREFGVEI